MTSLLETAKQVVALENVLSDARETQMFSDKWGELVDAQNTLLEQDGPTLAAALVEAEKLLRLVLPMALGYAHANPVGRNQEMCEDARAFLSRISTASSTLDALRDELKGDANGE